jgi:hypothetical protein
VAIKLIQLYSAGSVILVGSMIMADIMSIAQGRLAASVAIVAAHGRAMAKKISA